MKHNLKWICKLSGEEEYFEASVPGNVQFDYAKYKNWGDVNYGENCKKFDVLEDRGWVYKTEFNDIREDNKRLYFVSFGIDYECDIYINKKHIFHHIGMFEKIELDITDYVEGKNIFEVVILPPPKDKNCPTHDRSQAAQSVKPAVSYGWDWHPRLIPTGIWQDTYFETRGKDYINYFEPFYTLSDDLKEADLTFETDKAGEVEITLFDPEGKQIYKGFDLNIHLDSIYLWWCNGQGDAHLYKYEAKGKENAISGYIGFKKVELVMNEGAWDEPSDFPKSRSVAPISIKLNNRKIFAKGSNFVPPEIFYANITFERYDELLKLVKDANMNILRCWGGGIVGKKEFFDLCDKYGIMVWQEFPLACNNYYATKGYLKSLEQEATYIIKSLRSRACLVLWCGGNELFNRWSGMTDQSLALRLLNKLCYDLDREKPFIMTSPLMGMAHGHYMFHDKNTDTTIYDTFSDAGYTAYPEFGVPSIASMDILKKFIPEKDFDNIAPNTVWELHHGFNSWDVGDIDTWLCFNMIDRTIGKQNCLEEYIEKSLILQGEGLKYIFEEARRQKPHCSMALNWCFDEPWVCVANQSIVSYPAIPKKSYYCVKDALRDVMPSLKMSKIKYEGEEEFSAQLWILNDSQKEVETKVEVYLEFNDTKTHILTWNTPKSKENSNIKGHTICFKVPNFDGEFKVILESGTGNSTYRFFANKKKEKEQIYTNSLNG